VHSSHTAAWVNRHIQDEYVKRAQQDQYRSRSAYKIMQMDDRYTVFRKNQVVVDLGCYPGGFSQVALERCIPSQSGGKVIGIDRLKIDPLPGMVFLHTDVRKPDATERLLRELGPRKADVVLSDLAPKLIGVRQDDHLASAELCLHAADIAEKILVADGSFVVKMFLGGQTQNYKVYLQSRFKKVHSCKPRASREESPEMFFVCKGFFGRAAFSEEVQVKSAFSHREGSPV